MVTGRVVVIGTVEVVVTYVVVVLVVVVDVVTGSQTSPTRSPSYSLSAHVCITLPRRNSTEASLDKSKVLINREL